MKKPKIIKRGTMTYYIYVDKVYVCIGNWQWCSFNQYENWNRQGITQFRQTILKSKKDEYTGPADMLSLAHACGIRSTGTTKPKDIE